MKEFNAFAQEVHYQAEEKRPLGYDKSLEDAKEIISILSYPVISPTGKGPPQDILKWGRVEEFPSLFLSPPPPRRRSQAPTRTLLGVQEEYSYEVGGGGGQVKGPSSCKQPPVLGEDPRPLKKEFFVKWEAALRIAFQTQNRRWLLTQLHCPLCANSGHLPAEGSPSRARRPRTRVCSHTQPSPKLAAHSFAWQPSCRHQAVPAPPRPKPRFSKPAFLDRWRPRPVGFRV